MKDFYAEIAAAILNGMEVSLPCNMGNILVNKKQSDNRRFINYKESRLQGRTVSENNSHTGGYRFSIQWRKDDPILGIQKGYQFKASRLISRKLAEILKTGGGYKYQSRSNKKIDKHEI